MPYLVRHGEADQTAHIAANAITALAPAQRIPLLIGQARVAGKAITAASARAGRHYTEILREAIPA
jgi:hypothetical protein